MSTGGALGSSLGAQGLNAARSVLESSTIDASVPRPRLGDWWQDLWSRILGFIAELLNREAALVEVVLKGGAWLVIGLAALVLVRFAWTWFFRRDQVTEDAGYTRVQVSTNGMAVDDGEWSARLDAALALGDVPAALEALWFVVAARLSVRLTGRSADQKAIAQLDQLVSGREWTGRRLLAASGALRSSLAPGVRALERHTYGNESASVEDVRMLRAGFDQVLQRGDRVGLDRGVM